MMFYLGIVPSSSLLDALHQARAQQRTGVPLAPLRDHVLEQLQHELPHAFLSQCAEQLPSHHKAEPLVKLCHYIQLNLQQLFHALEYEDQQHNAKACIQFWAKSLFKDLHGQTRIGIHLDPRLATNLLHYFKHMQLGHSIDAAALTECYKQCADALLKHFLHDFLLCLDLNMQNAKHAELGRRRLMIAIHEALDRVVPCLNRQQLKVMAYYYQDLLHGQS